MVIPAKPKYGVVLLVILLVGSSAVYAKTNIAPSTSIPAVVSRSTSALSVPATELDLTSSRATITIPRGGDVAVGFAARLKVGSYFAIWYILNIIYNSKYLKLQYSQTS